jgi:hypothetical protein
LNPFFSTERDGALETRTRTEGGRIDLTLSGTIDLAAAE